MTRATSKDPVTFRVIVPRKLETNGMDAIIRDAVIKAAKDMGKDLQATTKTWKGDKPRIQTEAKLVPPSNNPPASTVHRSYTASTWAREDSSMGYKKFNWLEKGTKVRRAIMSKPFIPKTRVRQLNSWRGKGGVVFISKKVKRPGIKARKWTETLYKKWNKPSMFKARMDAAIKKAAKASGHKV